MVFHYYSSAGRRALKDKEKSKSLPKKCLFFIIFSRPLRLLIGTVKAVAKETEK
jgi:hypothetical protein